MELVRILVVFSIVFVAIPAAAGARTRDGSVAFRAAAGFVRASLFFRISIMFAGLVGAAFPGIIVSLWAAWLLAMMIWFQERPVPDVKRRVQDAFLRILRALEVLPGRRFVQHVPRFSQIAVLVIVLATGTLLHRAWYSLHNVRFATIESYSRTADLQSFMQRDARGGNGADFILAPLGVMTGMYADAVIRFSGPLFSTLLVLATGLCAYRFLGTAETGLTAAVLMAVWPAVAGQAHPGEISSSEFAAVYWVLGAAFIGRSYPVMAYAFCTALLSSWRISPMILVAAGCIALAYVLIWLLRKMPVRPGWAASAGVGLTVAMLLADINPVAPDGPFEYEAAARASKAIAAQFPKSEWMIVSPVHELAFTYGRGWHLELLNFVSSYSLGQVALKDFAFPYDVPDIFVFVEKNPLHATHQNGSSNDFTAVDLTQTMDPAILAYNTGMGRASIEFQAGALMTAYAANHPDVSIFHEDERLLIFHLKGRRDNRTDVRRVSNGS